MALAPVLLLPLLSMSSAENRDRDSAGERDRGLTAGDRESGVTVVFPSLASGKISSQLDQGPFVNTKVHFYYFFFY